MKRSLKRMKAVSKNQHANLKRNLKGGYMKEGNFLVLNRIVLGLLMLVAGLLKLFVMGPSAIVSMMSGIAIFAWAPMFWAWVLILSEILFGLAILAKWKLEWTTIPPAIIMVVAGLTVYWGNWSSLLLHFAAASNYLLWMAMNKKR